MHKPLGLWPFWGYNNSLEINQNIAAPSEGA